MCSHPIICSQYMCLYIFSGLTEYSGLNVTSSYADEIAVVAEVEIVGAVEGLVALGHPEEEQGLVVHLLPFLMYILT